MQELIQNIISNPTVIVIIYIIVSFIGILLHDMKYLFFLNGTNIAKSCIVTGVYCIFNTLTTINIASQPVYISLPVITITNMISMWIAMTYSQKTMKEYIFKYEITTKYLRSRFELKDAFKAKNIPYEYSTYWYENDKGDDQSEFIEKNDHGESLYHKYEIYAFSKKHSKQLEELLNSFDKKYVKWIKDDTGYFKE